jgi:hypothetical protein
VRVKRVPSQTGSGRLPLARRTLVHYVATCRDCEELPSSPRKASVHATAEKHHITESKTYVVEPEDAS